MLLSEGLARPLKPGRPCIEVGIENAGLSMIIVFLQCYSCCGRRISHADAMSCPLSGRYINANKTEHDITWPCRSLCLCRGSDACGNHTVAACSSNIHWSVFATSRAF